MIFDIYSVLKFAHLGSNAVWTFLWFNAKNSCGQVIIFTIASIHGILSLIGFVVFIVLRIFGKTENTNQWKYIIIVSIFSMLFCYLICVIELFVSF